MGDTGEEPPELRVGDADRRSATEALDTHLAAGRLSAQEYGERWAAATLAVHSSELSALFRDLPAPHPTLPRRPGERSEPATPSEVYARPVRREPHPLREDAVGHGADGAATTALALAIMLAIGLPALVLAGAGIGAVLLLPLMFLLAGSAGRHHGRRRE